MRAQRNPSLSTTQWKPGPWVDGLAALGVVAGVRLWLVDLDHPIADQDLRALAPDELDRAARFVHDSHRRRYGVARARLRQLLATATGTSPAALQLRPGRDGKPRLAETAPGRAPAFSLSHCEHLGLVGIAPDGDIGVDIELIRPMPEFDALARDHFTPAERAALQSLPPAQRDAGFLRAWTRKEACLKAVGCGLTATAAAGLSDGTDDAIVTTEVGRATVHVQSLQLPLDAVAAVALVHNAERDVVRHYGLRE